MRQNITLLSYLLIVCITIISCKKDDTPSLPSSKYETIYPGPYLPAYPGSYWRYKYDDSTLDTITTDPHYVLHSYKMRNGLSSDSVYVPRYGNTILYQYNRLEYIPPPFGDYDEFWPFISDKVGKAWTPDWYDYRHQPSPGYRKVRDKIVEGSDTSLIIEGASTHYFGDTNHLTFSFYTKDIGLTKAYKVDTSTKDTIWKKELIDYYINKKPHLH